ncbi:hypothetical protein [Sphingobacterium sp. BIGb0116]|uniref:hypothetical protein n=1 Tax=Sphingobacterium sp. BIGb0116 TaxID=2940619 RepID=UPI00216AA542|nr:hypothetical protein [Sphingobacterium sp. BIGb0116]MCS4165186.1 ElaB/YqjD/DUF883 family membrane-anchored ribosome-binding protein [Sphingobacterium sp. BIGb0116]
MNICRLLLFCLSVCCISSAYAQENLLFIADSTEVVHAAEVYIQKQYRQHLQYQQEASRAQQRMLRKLQRQEFRLAAKLQRSDSILYVQYQKLNAANFDSIRKTAMDTALLNKMAGMQPVKALDSLKKIQSFIQQKIPGGTGLSLPGMDKLNSQLNAQEYLKGQLKKRSDALNRLLAQSAFASKLGRLNKAYGYGTQQAQYWKKIVQDPDATEEKALDLLQGIEGFNEMLSRSSLPGMSSGNLSEQDLKQMCYQTKSSVNAALEQQFGNQLQQVQQQAAQQVQDYSKQLGLEKQAAKVMQAAQAVNEAKNTIRDTKDKIKQSRQGLRNPMADLKNPMRGIPFWQRWEYQYNLQTQRASPNGQKPVMLQAGLNAAYRHSPRISIGIGLDASLGLGRDWQHLKLSYEGLTGRVFLDGQLIWGISLQGGYEKSLKPLNRPYVQLQERYGNASNVRTAMGLLQDAVYIGLMKTYRINRNQQGTFLIGYNFLNDKTGINSPWIIRLGYKI